MCWRCIFGICRLHGSSTSIISHRLNNNEDMKTGLSFLDDFQWPGAGKTGKICWALQRRQPSTLLLQMRTDVVCSPDLKKWRCTSLQLKNDRHIYTDIQVIFVVRLTGTDAKAELVSLITFLANRVV